jgi:Protein of unknown function (DUF2591)
MKTSELSGPALDWAVAKCAKIEHYFDYGVVCLKGQPFDNNEHYWLPTQNWSQGGPIIEREKIEITAWGKNQWRARSNWSESYKDWVHVALFEAFGPTPLIAAMRCFVESKLGNEIDIPEERK